MGYLSVVCLLKAGEKLLLNRKPLYFDGFFVQTKLSTRKQSPLFHYALQTALLLASPTPIRKFHRSTKLAKTGEDYDFLPFCHLPDETKSYIEIWAG